MKLARRLGFLLLLMAALTGAGLCADPPVTRYILSHEGKGSFADFALVRAGRPVAPLGNLFPLQTGDCLSFDAGADATSTLTVIVDGLQVLVNQAHPRYCVPSAASGNAVTQAIAHAFTSIAYVFHQSELDYDAQGTTTTASRGPGGATTPVILMLLGDHQQVAGGTRVLALAWAGGVAPFRVSVLADGAAAPVAAATSAATAMALPSHDYATGAYHVVVRDAKGATATGAFTVVDASALPALTPDEATAINDPSTPRDLAASLDAARLMADPTGHWGFEAYQRIIGYQDDSPLARRLVYELQVGG